ncbi:MAG: hypothetical protein HRT74_10825 [Flavobacteriales bacterium]|nr:hypothetical protein [Flavobacteriales bacterium]
MKKVGFLITALTLIIFASCKKSEEFVNPEYMCECGNITWQGEQFPLLAAEYTRVNDSLPLSRRYYLTADVASETETETHSVNIYFDLDSIDQPEFFINLDTVDVYIEEIDLNSDLPFKTFTATDGIVNVNGAVLGGRETASMDLILRQTVGGAPAGLEFSFKGNFAVFVE